MNVGESNTKFLDLELPKNLEQKNKKNNASRFLKQNKLIKVCRFPIFFFLFFYHRSIHLEPLLQSVR